MLLTCTKMILMYLDMAKKFQIVNSSPPNAAYMHQKNGSSLFQEMACRLFGANPWTNDALLPIGFLGRNVGEVCIGILSFSFKKMHLKMSSAKMVANLFRGWRWVNLMSPVLNGQHLADRIIECSFWKMSSIAQWNLSVTTTSTIKFITCDLFSNVF